MNSQSTTALVNEDWQNREILELVQLNLMQVVSFVNKFDVSTREKLSRLNEKLTKLERSLEMAEVSIISSQQTEGGAVQNEE
jgi:signal recognition particle receptor subunit beta